MSRSPSSSAFRLASLWTWVAGFVPALVLLAMILPLRVPVPYADSWAFVSQYQSWAAGQYGWQDLLHKHGDHPSAPGKVIYFAVLHWLGGNVGILPLLSWGFSLVISASVCVLSRPLWKGSPVLGAMLMFCANLTIFSAAQGGVWIWDFTFQNYIPGACLAVGLLVLTTGPLNPWRVAAASLLGMTAAFAFGSGFLVGVFLSFVVWYQARDAGTRRRCFVTAVCLLLTGIAASVALSASGPPGKPLGLSILVDRPLMRLQFVFTILGQMLGKGTVIEPLTLGVVVGGVLMIVFLACVIFVFQRRRDRALVSAALPWLVFCFYGLSIAALVCIGRLGKSASAYDAFNSIYALAERTMAERFIISSLFFVFGTVMLAATVLRHIDATGARMRILVAPLLALFVLLHVCNWEAGWQLMKLENILMKQERAMLAFGDLVPPDPDRLWNTHSRNGTVGSAKSLAAAGKLQGIVFLPDNRLASLQRDRELPKKWAGFDKPVPLDEGGWKLGGTCGVPGKDYATLPDLVVITAEGGTEGEKIVTIAAPRLPETFLERQSQRRKYPEHYFGWSQSLDSALLSKGASTLRAYAFDAASRTVRPINGAHTVEAVAK